MVRRLGGGVYVGGVGLGFSDQVDSVFAASFGFEQGFVGLLEEFLYGGAVAGETRQSAAYREDSLARGSEAAGGRQFGGFQFSH